MNVSSWLKISRSEILVYVLSKLLNNKKKEEKKRQDSFSGRDHAGCTNLNNNIRLYVIYCWNKLWFTIPAQTFVCFPIKRSYIIIVSDAAFILARPPQISLSLPITHLVGGPNLKSDIRDLQLVYCMAPVLLILAIAYDESFWWQVPD